MPLLCLEGVPDLPGAPQDEAGLTRKFEMLIVSFDVQKLLRLIRSHLFIFAFISNILGGGS